MTQLLNSLLTKTKWQIVFIVGVIFLLYFRTLSFEFIGLDEQSLLEEKKSFNKELSNLPKAFTQHVFQIENRQSSERSNKYYRPLLTVSFILDEQFSGKAFTVHHFTNLLIHFFSAIGLLLVLQQLKVSLPLSFAFTLLFTAHPLLVQAIAWIPGRNDSLVCAFILWGFYFLTKQGNRNTALHLLFFTLALFTKENAVAFIPLCAFYILVLQKNSFSQKSKVLLFTSYAAILLAWFVARSYAIGEILNSGVKTSGSLYYSFLKSAPLLFQYFQKTILPVNLSVMSAVNDTNYGWVLLSFGLFGAAIYFSKKIAWNEILFGLAWFFLFFLPTLLFSYFEGMEHRAYLPMVGLLIAFAHTEPIQNLSRNTNKLAVLFGTTILIFGIITITRIPAFANELSYWENAFHTSKNSAVVCRDYGVILTKKEEYEKAEKAFLEGIRRDSKQILTHYNLGVLYFKVKQFEQAEIHLLQELRLDSTGNPMTYHVLGVIYKQTGKSKQAVEMWKKALHINPGFQPSTEELRKYQ